MAGDMLSLFQPMAEGDQGDKGQATYHRVYHILAYHQVGLYRIVAYHHRNFIGK